MYLNNIPGCEPELIDGTLPRSIFANVYFVASLARNIVTMRKLHRCVLAYYTYPLTYSVGLRDVEINQQHKETVTKLAIIG